MEEYLARARSLACMSPVCAKAWNALEDDIMAHPDVDALLAYAIASGDTGAAMVIMTMAED